MRKIVTMATGGAAVLVSLSAGTGFALGESSGDERPLTGKSLDRASDAALEVTGGGRVVDSERGDDGAVYEVEVRLDSGRQVEVELDDAYGVVSQEADDADDASDDGGPDDD